MYIDELKIFTENKKQFIRKGIFQEDSLTIAIGYNNNTVVKFTKV